MDVIKLFRNIVIILLILAVIVNIYLFISNKNSNEEIEAINEENTELRSENESLQYEVDNYSNTEREEYYNTLVEQADKFINLAYTVKQEGYEQRKSESEKIMNDDLIQTFYPSDTLYQEDIITEIDNPKIYIEKLEKGQNRVDALVEMEHKTDYLNNGKSYVSNLIVRITFENIEGEWIAVEHHAITEDGELSDLNSEEGE